MRGPRAGSVRLAPTAFVAPGAVILGEVTIGHRASVWFNTVVRGDVDTIEIGESSNVQDNSTVHVDEGSPCHIGARVTVGHRSIVHGCAIEDDCLIGMGSVLLSGCHIGPGSYIGAASLVLEGTRIPPGSVALGSPARVVGEVGARHWDGIRHGSETYAELAAACMRRGLARHVGRDGEIVSEFVPMTLAEWDMHLQTFGQAWNKVRQHFAKGRTDDRFRHVVERLLELDLARDACLAQFVANQEAVWGPPPPEPPDPELRALVPRWRLMRMSVCEDLAALGARGFRLIVRHPTRGPFLLSELVREWAEEDRELVSSLDARRKRGA